MSVSQKIDHLIEEATRFEKEIKKQPFKDQVSWRKRNNVYRSNNLKNAPTEKFRELAFKGNNDQIEDKTQFLKDFKFADRQSQQKQLNHFDKNHVRKTIFDFDRIRPRPILNKEGSTKIDHYGGKYHLEGLMSGNSSFKGYPIADNSKELGIQVHPEANLPRKDGDKIKDYSSLYASQGITRFGDDPVRLTGDIDKDKLKIGQWDFEAGLPTDNIKHIRNSKIENLNISPEISKRLPTSFITSVIKDNR